METDSLFLHLWETAEEDPVSHFYQDAPEILNCFVVSCVKYLWDAWGCQFWVYFLCLIERKAEFGFTGLSLIFS